MLMLVAIALTVVQLCEPLKEEQKKIMKSVV
jgi:hypothetical protein